MISYILGRKNAEDLLSTAILSKLFGIVFLILLGGRRFRVTGDFASPGEANSISTQIQYNYRFVKQFTSFEIHTAPCWRF